MISVHAEPRVELGKKAKRVRKNGFLPAVLYGVGTDTRAIKIPYRDFERAYRSTGESTLVTLELEGRSYNVLIHDVGHDVLTGKPEHADFFAVRMDRIIRATVPLEFIGESAAVKNEGGILVKILHSINVEALPADLPHSIAVDISMLRSFDDRINVGNLVPPKGVNVLADAVEMIAHVEPPRSEQELEALGKSAVPEAVAEVKTEQEERREKIDAQKRDQVASE